MVEIAPIPVHPLVEHSGGLEYVHIDGPCEPIVIDRCRWCQSMVEILKGSCQRCGREQENG